MGGLRSTISWLGLAAGVFWVAAGPLPAREPARPLWRSARTIPIPLDELPAACQRRIRPIVEQPTLSHAGKPEEFAGHPALYFWLVDHPDCCSRAWRRLDIPCMEIVDRGNGRFGWSDSHGSEIWWETLYCRDDCRIWYAEGRVRPALWLPPVPLKAVVFFQHSHQSDELGRPFIRHRADVFAQTDSKTAALVLRLLGPSIPSLAEQCVSQMGLFFSGLVRYCDHYPERTQELLFGEDGR